MPALQWWQVKGGISTHKPQCPCPACRARRGEMTRARTVMLWARVPQDLAVRLAELAGRREKAASTILREALEEHLRRNGA